MPLANPTIDELLQENRSLRRRLAEAEETLRAIRGGEVDALVVQRRQGDHILLLGDSSKPYQLLVERMMQGAVTLDAAGALLYCNESFARLLGTAPATALVGRPFVDFVIGGSAPALAVLLDDGSDVFQCELTLCGSEGVAVPVHAAVAPLHEVPGGVCLLLTDLTDVLHAHRELQIEMAERQRAEQALSAQAERLQLAIETASMGMWEVDLATGHITQSDQIGPMFGRPLGPVHTQVEAAYADVHPEDRPRLREVFTEAIARGAAFESEYRVLWPDGTVHWHRAKGLVHRAAPDDPGRALGVTLDVTPYKTVEASLRASEGRLRLALGAARMACWEIDYVNNTVFVTKDYGPMVGRPPGFQHAGTPDFMAGVHPDDRPRIEALWRDAEERQLDYDAEFRVVWPDGITTRWLHSTGRFVRDAAGRALRVHGTLQDVDQRRRSEDALRESDQLFRQFADNMKDIIWVANADLTKFFYVSKAYERIWGKSCQSLLDDMHSYRDAVHPDDVQHLSAPTAAEVRAGAPDHEFRMVRPDGSEGRLRTRFFPILDEAGNVVRIAGTTEDITDRVRLEEQFRQAAKMEAVGRLAGGVAHDFNNLLTIINGYSELLLARLPAQDALVGPAKQIQRAGERAASLTRQLLAFSRRQQLSPSRLDLNALIGDAEKMLRRLIGEDVELRCEPEPGLWPVRADAGQIEQVLMNLAVNARDAMPEGGTLTIATRNVAAAPAPLPPGDYVAIAVRDTGMGMDPPTLKQIFEPFFTTKGSDKGTGLGLATVYGIVKQSGGHIDVASDIGQGATFTIYLPRTTDKPAPTEAAPTAQLARPATETILLVEDEDNVRLYTRLVLVEKGYTVIEARNGQEALDRCLARATPIQLLLCDVVLPGIGGSRLAENLTALRPGLKTLFMSGYTGDALDRHGIDEAGVPYLQKPFTPDALTAKVREVLDTV